MQTTIAPYRFAGIGTYFFPLFPDRLVLAGIARTIAGAASIFLLVSGVAAQDYAREQRLADELLPGLLVGDPVQLPIAGGRTFLGLYAKGKPDRRAIVLVHGVGTHPDAGVIGQLRQLLNDLGHTTLSIQMPVQRADAVLEDYYPSVFDEAKMRIAQAANWMAERGHVQPALLSHAMGSWMANEYFDEHHQRAAFSAWVCLSLTGGYSWSARTYRLPILDVYAENDIPAAVSSAWRRRLALTGVSSRQFMVKTAAPDYARQERVAAAEISRFLQ